MSEDVSIPLFYARVKLPVSAGYAPCPSGDNEYEDDYRKALASAVPVGFEAKRWRSNEKWAVDSEGYTLVPLVLVDEKASLAYWISKCADLQRQITTMKAVAKTIAE